MSLRFKSGSENCHAWFYKPHSARENHPVPIVVLAHGLGGVKQMLLDRYAQRFHDAGYACLVFDYGYLGESSGEPRGLVDVNGQLEDWRSAVAFARTLPGVDPERVILWGTSFAGGHVIVTAAQDPRIAAAVLQCPFTDGPAAGRVMALATKIRLGVKATRDVIASWLGSDPVRIPLVGRPGEVAMLTTPDAVPGFQALLKASGVSSVTDLPARIVFQVLRYRPGSWAKDVKCPIFFCICDSDSVAPAPETLAYARQARKGEIKHYPEGHFEIYVGEPMERIVTDQIAFLAVHVPVSLARS
jgi:fermentation-respiration switch protein FrsA (DUF1100 family)